MARKRERSVRKESFVPAAATPAAAAIDWRRHAYTVLAIWVLALAAYSNSFGGQLQVDSGFVINGDPRIRAATSQNIGAIWSGGYWFNYADTTLYRPLTTLSYLVNYSILGNQGRPEGYHWVNFLLHAINVALVYGLALFIFRSSVLSAALAAVWAVHPVLTESVTNIVGRADIMATLGVLAGLFCHAMESRETGTRRAGWLAGLAAASAFAVFSKESGIVLILLMAIYDLAVRRDGVRFRFTSYAAAALPVAIFLYQRWQVLAPLPIQQRTFGDNPLIGLGFWSSRLTAIQVIGRYMWLLVWPQHLSYDYSYNQIPLFRGSFDNGGDWATVLSLLVCLAAAALIIAGFRRRWPAFFWMSLFFVALAPVANIALLIGTIMAERLLYLPALGFLGCVVWAIDGGVDRLNRKWPSMRLQSVWVFGLLCLALLVRTHTRNSDWDNTYALYSSGVRAAPDSFRTHVNMAVISRERGDLDRAVSEGERAMAIIGTMPPGTGADMVAYDNIGAIYRLKGETTKSRSWYEKSLRVLQEGDRLDRKNSGQLALLNRGPGRPQVIFGTPGLYQNLALAHLRLGEPKKAIEALDYGLGIRPTPEFFPILASAYLEVPDRESAAVALMEGLVIEPGQQRLMAALVSLYQNDPSGCALNRNGGNVSLNPGCPVVRSHLCAGADRARELYERRGQFGEAARVRQTATASFGCPAP